MESPPQYPGAPKKSKTGLILGLSALVIVLCCCGGVGSLFYLGRGVMGKAFGLIECSTALSEQRDGLLAYAAKHGGKLPGQKTWQDDIKPYVTPTMPGGRAGNMIHIPTPDEGTCDRGSDTSIAYNGALAGQKVDGIKNPYGTVLLFEAPGKGRNKSAPWHEPPFATSPIMVKGERRGWIRQPVEGPAFYKDKFGRNMPAPTGNANASFGPVDVQTRTSKGDKDDSGD